MEKLRFAVITVSDSCYDKKAEDISGPLLCKLVAENFPGSEIQTNLVPDDLQMITETLLNYVKVSKVHAIFTTGGTGFAPRDVTPEATSSVVSRECPQLALVMALESLKKTPFAALSRAKCGIRENTLIVNFPGSAKAVRECFDSIKGVLPHALSLINNQIEGVRGTHAKISAGEPPVHVCPHKTGTGDRDDRNSPFPMLPVRQALDIVVDLIGQRSPKTGSMLDFAMGSPVNIPPFRASIKDGYAVKSSGFSGTKRVLGYISAGDPINNTPLTEDECFKINTGAALPKDADCIIQVEDTKLLRINTKTGLEELVEILVDPKPNLDIRAIGSDLAVGQEIFPSLDVRDVAMRAIMASVGLDYKPIKPKVAVISTGTELLQPREISQEGKIYDSNTTMLVELLKYFSFECNQIAVVGDNFETVKEVLNDIFQKTDFVICTGGVSMGDKDYIKPALESMGFSIKFGRVNMKPGKPMTFAALNDKYFFGLPGNPVSAFVTFHIFVLPALRTFYGYEKSKCELATIFVKLENEALSLDPRPEYVRASITSRNGELFANATGNQISSRLQSIVGADVLLHLPGRTADKPKVVKNEILKASILRYDFISKYE